MNQEHTLRSSIIKFTYIERKIKMAENQQKGPIQKLENKFGNIKNVIAVMSGKGGVGKSLVTAMLAASAADKGFKVGVMDADITGPSIPKQFGVKKKIESDGKNLIPAKTVKGIEMISINLMLKNEDDPVIWRGPLISGVVKQFYEEVMWSDLDYLFVDMPPGTGDVPLTVMQSLPLTGMVIVTSPQELVAMIVKKAINMAEMMNIPVLGLVENMSYVECPKCKEHINLFGESTAKEVAEKNNVNLLGNLPIIPDVAKLGDEGRIELVNNLYPEFFKEIIENLLKSVEND